MTLNSEEKFDGKSARCSLAAAALMDTVRRQVPDGATGVVSEIRRAVGSFKAEAEFSENEERHINALGEAVVFSLLERVSLPCFSSYQDFDAEHYHRALFALSRFEEGKVTRKAVLDTYNRLFSYVKISSADKPSSADAFPLTVNCGELALIALRDVSAQTYGNVKALSDFLDKLSVSVREGLEKLLQNGLPDLSESESAVLKERISESEKSQEEDEYLSSDLFKNIESKLNSEILKDGGAALNQSGHASVFSTPDSRSRTDGNELPAGLKSDPAPLNSQSVEGNEASQDLPLSRLFICSVILAFLGLLVYQTFLIFHEEIEKEAMEKKKWEDFLTPKVSSPISPPVQPATRNSDTLERRSANAGVPLTAQQIDKEWEGFVEQKVSPPISSSVQPADRNPDALERPPVNVSSPFTAGQIAWCMNLRLDIEEKRGPASDGNPPSLLEEVNKEISEFNFYCSSFRYSEKDWEEAKRLLDKNRFKTSTQK
jgi:hypothetical protein